jgi:hypothetical protein
MVLFICFVNLPLPTEDGKFSPQTTKLNERLVELVLFLELNCLMKAGFPFKNKASFHISAAQLSRPPEVRMKRFLVVEENEENPAIHSGSGIF